MSENLEIFLWIMFAFAIFMFILWIGTEIEKPALEEKKKKERENKLLLKHSVLNLYAMLTIDSLAAYICEYESLENEIYKMKRILDSEKDVMYSFFVPQLKDTITVILLKKAEINDGRFGYHGDLLFEDNGIKIYSGLSHMEGIGSMQDSYIKLERNNKEDNRWIHMFIKASSNRDYLMTDPLKKMCNGY